MMPVPVGLKEQDINPYKSEHLQTDNSPHSVTCTLPSHGLLNTQTKVSIAKDLCFVVKTSFSAEECFFTWNEISTIVFNFYTPHPEHSTEILLPSYSVMPSKDAGAHFEVCEWNELPTEKENALPAQSCSAILDTNWLPCQQKNWFIPLTLNDPFRLRICFYPDILNHKAFYIPLFLGNL